MLKRYYKYGIKAPRNVEEALEIDKETSTSFWRLAIEKEILNVKQAFEFQPDDKLVPVGYKWILLQMKFDLKINFTCKARLVTGGHLTGPPTTLTYSSVVSRESVRQAFLISALNDLNILNADIGNAFINSMTKEKVYTAAGKEFGECTGQTIFITRALYCLKSSGAAWRSHLVETLRDMNFKSSYADPDVWMRVAYKEDGTSFYEVVLCYVDDLLCMSVDPAAILRCVEQTYQLKEKPCKPEHFLGATVKEFYFQGDAKPRWAMLSNEYVTNAIKTVETELAKWDKKLSTKAITPLASGYWPEFDVSHYLDDDRTNYF